jgi:hypothetical protein
MPPQHRLDELLRYAVGQLGSAPRAAQRCHCSLRLAGGRQAKAGQLVPGVAREVGNVGGEIARHAERAHLVGKAEASEVLHRARLRGVRLRVEGGTRLVVDEHHADAAPPQLVGEHQPARASAGDEHLGLWRECRQGTVCLHVHIVRLPDD